MFKSSKSLYNLAETKLYFINAKKYLIIPNIKTFFFFVIVLLTILGTNVSAQDLASFKSTVIIIPDKPASLENRSAFLLSKWLKNIYKTDSGFPVLKEHEISNSEGTFFIKIGDVNSGIFKSSANNFDASFNIKRVKNELYIRGQSSLGTLLGVNYFLDQYCGVRFYLPGDLFATKAKSKIIIDKSINISQSPFTKYVFSTGFKTLDESAWALNNGLVRKNFGSHQHSMSERFYDDSIFKLFPEIFPLINGQRYFPVSKQDQKWEPDFSEPKLVDAAVYSAIKYFKQNPQYDYISFSVQDSKIYPTEGKMGSFLKSYANDEEGKKRGYTDAFVTFLNKVAERLQRELPANGITKTKNIIYLVYGYVRMVPTVKLHPNILPVTVFQISGSLMGTYFKDDGILAEWSKVTNRIGNHDWAEGLGFIYPRIYTNLLAQYLKTVEKDNMAFEFAHLEMYPNWALDGPKNYLMSKLYWNPNLNTDSILTLFCNDIFGKSKILMKNYFLTLEALNTSMNNNLEQRRGIRAYITQLPLNSKELQLVHQARQYIDEAYLTAQTSDQKERIDFFSKGFRMSEGFFDLYNSDNIDVSKADNLKDYIKNTISGNQMILNEATDKNFEQKMDALIDQIVKQKKLKSKNQN